MGRERLRNGGGRGVIRLRGVSVHNLQEVDLDLPREQLIVICGVSGSGKSSLAIDTLFAEGQRRYVESFSAYARQFLARLPRPQAREIVGIPPAVAVAHRQSLATSRRTLGAATEISDHLRIMFARAATAHCPQCGRELACFTPSSAADWCRELPSGQRYVIAYQPAWLGSGTWSETLALGLQQGHVRWIVGENLVHLARDVAAWPTEPPSRSQAVYVVLDRLRAVDSSTQRAEEALEIAMGQGEGRAHVFLECTVDPGQLAKSLSAAPFALDGQPWLHLILDSRLRCTSCDRQLPQPEPALFHEGNALGACPECEGRGVMAGSDSATVCPGCSGAGLRPEALAFTLAGHSIFRMRRLPIRELLDLLQAFRTGSQVAQEVNRILLEQVHSRLTYLQMVGLDYLTLDRPLMSLSSGELQRVALTTALGTSLVNMLYVLDEPSSGLHAKDVLPVLDAVRMLRDRGNSVIVVEHDEAMIRAADWVVEIGPAAGTRGGRVTFQGTPVDLCETNDVLTGSYLTGRRGGGIPEHRRPAQRGRIRILGATGNNLQNLDAEFPLGLLMVVAGVSGSGKTSLVEQTLYPAVCRRKRKAAAESLPFREVTGEGAIDDIVLVDQSPIGRTPRSNPVTFIKAFDEIREVFAETAPARMRNLQASHFSFNVDGGGRCETCHGDGSLTVDMQFLADVRMECPDCHGQRYRRDILEVLYRGKSIADVLAMTTREAFPFFRGLRKVQLRLQKLMDVGLDYIRLGQPASTLSSGEAQRLKLAAFLGSSRRARILFLLDEPTRGLHFHDIVQLLDCFDALLSAGHSLIVVEHNLQLLRAADYILELGPGAGASGGRIVAAGTPEHLARCLDSPTGSLLR